MSAKGLLVAIAGFAGAVAVVVGAPSPVDADGSVRAYRVTIANLTGGQPLTPPVLVTHRQPLHVFELGAPSSFEVTEVAENGNLGLLLSATTGSRHVADVVAAGMPIVPAANPGGTSFPSTMTLTIEASEGAKYLSWVSMLICTNDGLTGLDGVRLPEHVDEVVVTHTAGYDNGSELNTEDFADIVPPCQALIGVSSGEAGTGTSNPALAEGGVIRHHPGILGGADLIPGVHGWTDPVARVTIERTA